MSDLSLADWLKLATLLPALLAAWKVPVFWNWIKMRLAASFATAVMAQLAPTLEQLQNDVASVRYQVFPNGGGSMSDQLNRVLDSARATESTVMVLRDTMRAHHDADAAQVHFEADAGGRFTWASQSLQRWCAKALEQITGFGWFNCVAHEDRELVREEWTAAMAECREFNLRFRLLDPAGAAFPVEAHAKPLRMAGEIKNWVGVITKTS